MIPKTPKEGIIHLAQKTKERRLDFNITQKDLATKSNVSLAVIRQFERTGQIALLSFLKIAFVLDFLDDLLRAPETLSPEPQSIEDLFKDTQPSKRKRARARQ